MDQTAEQLLLRDIDLFVEENKEGVLRDLKTLVDIPSVENAPAPGAPFGADVKRALDAALEMARGMGLAPHSCEGYFGYADLPGKSEKQLGVITHLDVVPAGNGWAGDPFGMIRREGYVLGRGVADDKGPAVLTLYAAKFFAQRGEPLPYTLRLLFGTNEETGMAGLSYYLAHNAAPAFCFTPDAEFPVCYAEKGIYNGSVHSARLTGSLVSFEGGVAGNVVPDLAVAVVRADAAALRGTDAVTVEDAGEGLVRITGHGKGGHASLPQGTVNAILLVTDYLLDHALCSESERAFLRFLHTLLCVTDGSTVGIAAQDDIFGALTCIGGTLHFADGVLTQTLDIRYPTTTTGAALTQALTAAAAAAGAVFAPRRDTVPFVTSASDPAVKALIDVYNEVTGEHAAPFSMGGGTYAREFPRAVSFGMEDPGADYPAWVGSMHGANEGIPETLLWKSLKIYILGIARLMEQPL